MHSWGRLTESGFFFWCFPLIFWILSYCNFHCSGSKLSQRLPPLSSCYFYPVVFVHWLPYGWRHDSASKMRPFPESLLDWLNFTGNRNLLAVLYCCHPVPLNGFKFMCASNAFEERCRVWFLLVMFTPTLIMCIFSQRWWKLMNCKWATRLGVRAGSGSTHQFKAWRGYTLKHYIQRQTMITQDNTMNVNVFYL